MKITRYLFPLLCLVGCDKINPTDPVEDDFIDVTAPASRYIEQEKIWYGDAYGASIPEHSFLIQGGPPDFEYDTYVIPAYAGDKLIDLHFNIVPLYVFGEDNKSGDYYAVSGYVIVHNNQCFSNGKIKGQVGTIDRHGWYTGKLGLDFTLLDKDGKPVSAENVSFYSEPKPGTTIGSTTYTSGFTFNLTAGFTLGKMKYSEEVKSAILLGIVGFTFDWNTEKEQYLPDQSVMTSTGIKDRSVSYSFNTNNDSKGKGASSIPNLFRNDQRVDFDWIWHVKSGAYSAKDYGEDGMKISAKISNEFRTKVDSDGEPLNDPEIKTSSMKSVEKVFDIPTMNRVPIGTLKFKNTTKKYVSNAQFWKSGTYGQHKEPFCSVKGAFDTNETFKQILREGKYDLYYDLLDGDTGRSYGRYVVRNIEVKKNATIFSNTMHAEKL